MKIELGEIHIHLHSVDAPQLRRIEEHLATLVNQGRLIMNEQTALKNAVAKLTSVDSSVIALLQGLSQQIADLEPNQEAIDALAKSVNDQADALAAAVVAATPVAPGGGGTTTPPADVVTQNADGSTTTVHTNDDGTKTTSTSADSEGNIPQNNPDGSVNPSTV